MLSYLGIQPGLTGWPLAAGQGRWEGLRSRPRPVHWHGLVVGREIIKAGWQRGGLSSRPSLVSWGQRFEKQSINDRQKFKMGKGGVLISRSHPALEGADCTKWFLLEQLFRTGVEAEVQLWRCWGPRGLMMRDKGSALVGSGMLCHGWTDCKIREWAQMC